MMQLNEAVDPLMTAMFLRPTLSAVTTTVNTDSKSECVGFNVALDT